MLRGRDNGQLLVASVPAGSELNTDDLSNPERQRKRRGSIIEKYVVITLPS